MLMLMLMLMFMFMFIMFMLWHVHVLRYYSPSQPNTLWRYPPRRNTLWRYPPFSDDVFYLSLKKPILPKGRIQGSKLPVIRTPRGTDFVHRAPAPHEP
jgi:hypothetical protein